MLPTNRQIKKLGEIGEIVTGTTPSKSIDKFWGGDIPFIKPPHLGSDKPVVNSDECLTTEGFLKAKPIPQGTIMVCCIGSLGKTGIAGRELCTNQQINSIIFDKAKVNFKYGYYFCTTLEDHMKKIANQAVVQIINKTQFSQIKIPLPPLSTQQAIVAKLDQIHAEISANQSAIHQQLAQLDELWQSSLDQIFSNKEWGKMKIKDFAEIRSGKRLPKGNFVQDIKTEYPYIRVSDFGEDGTIDLSNIKYITEDIFQQISRYIITDKDLYISIAGTIGKTGIIPSLLNGANLTENAVRLVYKEESKIYNKYVLYFTKSPSFAKQAGLATRTVAMPKLAITRLKDIKIPLPDLATQKAAVAKLDQIHEHISQLRVDYIAQLAQYEELRASVLDQAFKGQLVE